MDEIKHLSWTAGLLAYLDPEITERPAPPLTYTEAIKNSEAQIAAAWRLRNQDDGGPPEPEKYLAETDTQIT